MKRQKGEGFGMIQDHSDMVGGRSTFVGSSRRMWDGKVQGKRYENLCRARPPKIFCGVLANTVYDVSPTSAMKLRIIKKEDQ